MGMADKRSTTETSVPRSGPGRKPRFTSAELATRTLDAALEAVLRAGVSSGLDAIRIEKVIVEADVPRAATYDLWDSRGAGTSQENLRRATVLEITRSMPSGNAQSTLDYALAAIEPHLDTIENGSPEEVARVRSELIRAVASFNFQLLQDQRWRIYKALASSVASQSDPELRQAVVEGEEELLSSYGAMYEQLATMFELVLRPDLEMRHFVISTYALNEGLSNRIGGAFAEQTLSRDGVEWTVFAVGFEALVEHYFMVTSDKL